MMAFLIDFRLSFDWFWIVFFRFWIHFPPRFLIDSNTQCSCFFIFCSSAVADTQLCCALDRMKLHLGMYFVQSSINILFVEVGSIGWGSWSKNCCARLRRIGGVLTGVVETKIAARSESARSIFCDFLPWGPREYWWGIGWGSWNKNCCARFKRAAIFAIHPPGAWSTPQRGPVM